jgi:hypothetical protein
MFEKYRPETFARAVASTITRIVMPLIDAIELVATEWPDDGDDANQAREAIAEARRALYAAQRHARALVALPPAPEAWGPVYEAQAAAETLEDRADDSGRVSDRAVALLARAAAGELGAARRLADDADEAARRGPT